MFEIINVFRGGTSLLICKRVDTIDEFMEVSRLRYEVYCKEKKFISEDNYPNHYEIDEYDDYSVHFIARTELETVGTVRLILHNPLGLPVANHYNFDISAMSLSEKRVAEISRFAIKKRALKIYGLDKSSITLELIRCLYHEVKKNRISHLCAAMENSLQRLLHHWGIQFHQIGYPLQYYNGLCSIYFAKVEEIEASMMINKPDLFDLISNFTSEEVPWNPIINSPFCVNSINTS